MAILREIHFRERSFTISERADALDYFKADFRDVLLAQPFQNRAALKCNG